MRIVRWTGATILIVLSALLIVASVAARFARSEVLDTDRYVVVSSAEGWAPRSEILEFTDAATKQHIRLTEPLSLCGTITTTGRPLKRALVSVTRPTGESVATVRTDEAGHYQIPVPPTGRYILTVVDPHTQWVRSRQVPIIAAQSNTVDIDVESDDLSVATRHVLPGVGL